MVTLAPDPALVLLTPLEVATVASRLGTGPWSPVARRAVGLDDSRQVTAEACAAALAGLVARGLVAPAPAEDVVEVHPAVAAVVATLARATALVEGVDAAGARRRSLALVPGTGGLLIDVGPQGDLLVALLDADVPVPAAVATLRDDGAVETVRVVGADGIEVEPGAGEGTGSWPST